MTTMTRSEAAGSQRHAIRAGASIVLFWLLAALIVGTAHLQLDRGYAWEAAAVEIGAIVGVAFVYMRLIAPAGSVDHALLVGIVWLALAIVAEMGIAGYVHHRWFALLGSPARPVLRNVFLFVWIFAPALFARHEAVS